MTSKEPFPRAGEAFGLLDLPPELWSRICKLAVEDRDPVYIIYSSRNHQPSITRVCRGIRNECLPHFYTHNILIVYEVYGARIRAAQGFMERLGTSNLHRLGKFYHVSMDEGWHPDIFLGCAQSAGMNCRDMCKAESAEFEKLRLQFSLWGPERAGVFEIKDQA